MSEESLKKLEEQYEANVEAIKAKHLLTINVSEKADGEIELDIDAGESIELPEMTERLAKVAAAFIAFVGKKDVIAKYVKDAK
jgi:hypothetical protein